MIDKNLKSITGKEAITEIVIQQLPKYIRQVMHRGIGCRIVAEEIVWKVFMRFLENAPYEDKDLLRLQKEISIACKWKAIDYLRKKDFNKEQVNLEPEIKYSEDNFFNNMIWKDLIIKHKMLKKLRPKHRTLLDLLMEGNSCEEIAFLMNKPIKSIYQMIYTLRQKLYELAVQIKESK